MRKNQNGFGIGPVLLIAMVLGAAILIGLYVYQNQSNTPQETTIKSQDKKSSLTSTTKNKTIDSFMNGVSFQLLSATPAEFCSDERDVCYKGDTVFLKMNNPPLNDIMKVALNLNQQKWLLDDGDPINTWLKVNAKTTTDGVTTYVSNRDAAFNEYPKDSQYGLWVFFNPGLLGSQETLYREDEGIYFFAFNKEDTIKEAYSVRSSLPITDSFNIDDLMTGVDANSYILSVTYGAKS